MGCTGSRKTAVSTIGFTTTGVMIVGEILESLIFTCKVSLGAIKVIFGKRVTMTFLGVRVIVGVGVIEGVGVSVGTSVGVWVGVRVGMGVCVGGRGVLVEVLVGASVDVAAPAPSLVAVASLVISGAIGVLDVLAVLDAELSLVALVGSSGLGVVETSTIADFSLVVIVSVVCALRVEELEALLLLSKNTAASAVAASTPAEIPIHKRDATGATGMLFGLSTAFANAIAKAPALA